MAASDAQVLGGGHIQRDSRYIREFVAKAIDDLVGGFAALVERLQSDVHASRVHGTAAYVSGNRVDRGIILDDARQALGLTFHGIERDVLVTNDRACEASDVLLRKKALGNVNKQENIYSQGENCEAKHKPLVPKYPTQRSMVAPVHPVI